MHMDYVVTEVDKSAIKRGQQCIPSTAKKASASNINQKYSIDINFLSFNKDMQIQTVLLIFGLIAISMEVARSTPLSTTHCSVRFQETFKEALEIKRTCEEALYDGCCQVARSSNILNYTVPTKVYDINNLCHTTTPFTQDVFPPMQVRCDMDSNDGGWTVLIRRTPDVDKRERFNRTWDEYVEGFGDLNGEFWYGLKNMHCLTSREPMEVEVEMRQNGSESTVFSYDNFKIDGPTSSYTLYVSGKTHPHTEFLLHHNGMKFTTFDRDNDKISGNCADYSGRPELKKSAWWYSTCYTVVLTTVPNPLLWISKPVSYDYAELRVRPKSCKDSWKTEYTCGE